MANWTLPSITSGYIDFVTQMNDKFVDAATLQFGAPTNLPANTIRYNRSINIFEEWDLTSWNPKVIGLLGGGTGANTAAGARTNLGLGSMATQNSNAVAITGGSITGVNFDAGGITSGILALSRGGTGSSLVLAVAGYVLLSTGAAVAFDSGVNINSLNANNLSTGVVPDARLSANVPLKNVTNIFTASQFIQNTAPYLALYDTDQPVNQRSTRIINDNGSVSIQSLNDDGSNAVNLVYVTRGGVVVAGSFSGNLNGSNIVAGIVAPQFLGTGAPSAANFLRGDGTWAVASGGGGVVFPSGMISAFDVACPAGWTRYAALDNRFPIGSTTPGLTGGSSQHQHHFQVGSNAAGGHSHNVSLGGQAHISGLTNSSGSGQVVAAGSQVTVSHLAHQHNVDLYSDPFTVAGPTDGVGDHTHVSEADTDMTTIFPPYYSVVWCRKD